MFYLVRDDGVATGSSDVLTLGAGTGPVSNSPFTVLGHGSLRVLFPSHFMGNKEVYLVARSGRGASSGWWMAGGRLLLKC